MRLAIPRKRRSSEKQHFVMVIPDTHVGYVVDTPTYSIPAWDLCLQALAHNQDRLTHVVFLGDFGNWEPLTHWASLRADACFVEEDIALVNNRLDDVYALTSAAGIEVVFIEGNHEAWANQFEARWPAMRDVVNLKHRLRMDERGWTWVPENNMWAIGDCYFTHGHMRGVRNPADMIKKTGVSVVFGHNHQYLTASSRNFTGPHASWSMGCLASIDPPPPYARGEMIDTWVHGVGWVRVRSNGLFSVDFTRFIEESWAELPDGTELLANNAAIRSKYAKDQDIRKEMRKRYADRYFKPDDSVMRTEPHHGKTNAGHSVARTRRARIVRTLPLNNR